MPPNTGDKLPARQDPAWPFHEMLEKPEFRRAKGNFFPVTAHAVGHRVKLQILKTHRLTGQRRTRPAHDGRKARDEFAGRKWLRDIVVGPGFKAANAIFFFAPGGEHDDRDVRRFLVAAQTAAKGLPALYISGEESASQIRLRAERINAVDPKLFLASETDLGAVIAHIDSVKPELLIIDSVQTIGSAAADGSPGGVTQVREVAGALIRICKDRDITLLLVGHVTKDGSIAGPRLLEHIVDVVLQFEGERHSRLRLIRAIKNRFGASDEVGCFDLSDTGIESVLDPTGLFTSRHAEPVPGTCVTVTLEGRRPLLAEIQALVSQGRENDFGNSRRVTSGLDSARTAMTLAVLELRAAVRVGGRDVYAATVGGMKMSEPAADLALALAVASAAKALALPADLVAIGEVGLAGEIRKVSGVSRRLAEAHRLGFKRALVPAGSDVKIDGMEIVEVSRLDQALQRVKITGD